MDEREENREEACLVTPTKARRGRPPGSTNKQKSLNPRTPISAGVNGLKNLQGKPSTPKKLLQDTQGSTPKLLVRHHDRSARRKSVRNLLDRATVNEDASDDSDLNDDNLLARKIWEADEDDLAESEEDDDEEPDETEVKQSTKSRTARKKKKSPTPPANLPPHETYFWQNRPGRVKTSSNTLSSLSLLSHEAYHDAIAAYEDPHASSYRYLHTLHSRSFPQWRFELSESFNICLYGYGSKRSLVTDFAEYLHQHLPAEHPPKILIVNGYTSTLTLRSLLTHLAPLVYDCPAAELPKLPLQPRDLLTTLLAHLSSTTPSSPHHNDPDPSDTDPPVPESNRIYIFINSLDAAPLRKSPTPTLLAQLAAHPRISLLATCDTPQFPLLWDLPTRSRYNFVFHDTTTFISYAGGAGAPDGTAEIASVIDDVNTLLGRSGRTIQGKEGVGFVLRSLPENARGLYRILISEILASLDADDDDDGAEKAEGRRTTTTTRGGIEYKTLYRKTVEEFICSNEMGFRQLLKEFWDHDMIVSKKDLPGAGEVLGVPWRREEMEAILEELLE